MIELRPFAKLGGADHGWLKAKHHFSFGSYYDPEQYGPWLAAGVERRRDRAEHRLSRASPCQHGDHHLCPRRRDHPSGQPRQQGPHRGRRRAGDERRKRHASLRVQSGADADAGSSRSGSSRPRRAAQPTWGAKPFPKSDRSGKFVTIASGFAADNDALPIRADARVLATTLKAGESAEYAPDKTRNLYLVPAAGSVEVNGVRVNARDGARDIGRSAADDHRAGGFGAGAGRRGVSAQLVMPGLVPGIHDFPADQDVDGRDKPGHDSLTFSFSQSQPHGDPSWQKFSFSIIPPMVTSRPWRTPSPKARAKPAPPSTSSACRNWCREAVAKASHYKLDQAAPVAKIDELADYDAIIVGTGTRFGRMASQMANFLDQAGGLWAKGALHGKVGGAFTSTATQHGGQETTLFSDDHQPAAFRHDHRRPQLRLCRPDETRRGHRRLALWRHHDCRRRRQPGAERQRTGGCTLSRARDRRDREQTAWLMRRRAAFPLEDAALSRSRGIDGLCHDRNSFYLSTGAPSAAGDCATLVLPQPLPRIAGAASMPGLHQFVKLT